ncbi:MAG: nitrate- and nitrite sensing domain-containing protein [Rickettsiales bacterium]|nr:nitrate- and nitrite sensing domain-containing protein [Rickettsiales bacterium]
MSADPIIIYNFIHETQRERGLAALYLSKSNNNSDDLERQFYIVDDLVKNFILQKESQNSKILPLINSIKSLPKERKIILDKNVDVLEMILFYSQNLVSTSIELMEEIMISDQKASPVKISAFINFLKWKERVGFERAVGTKMIEEKRWSGSLKERIHYIISEQNAYERMFLNFVDKQVKDSIDLASKNEKVFRRIEKINESILSGVFFEDDEPITADEWFNIFTIKIDSLHKIGKIMLINLLTPEDNNLIQKETHHCSNIILGKSVIIHLSKIKKIKLLKGIDEECLNKILKYAHVTEYKKKEKIFLQNDSASKLYLILDGFIKIIKHGSSDDEAIIQIVGSSDEILETSVLSNNDKFTVTAEVVEDAEILSIPASIIRDSLKSDQHLVSNALGLIASNSQNIVSQFGQVLSKDIRKRVGWFFLKLLLENLGKSKKFNLPYSKVLIARYFDIQPETLSRIIRDFREFGITTKKDTIVLSDLYSLCRFCDSDTYSHCSIAGQEKCSSKNVWHV